jgi:hypothetical protein
MTAIVANPPVLADDPIWGLLHKPDIEYNDVEAVCCNLQPVDAEDIFISFHILTTLNQYVDEIQNWSLYSILSKYDFETPVRQFELDLSTIVHKRAQNIQTEIGSWNIQLLKEKVYGLPAFHSDAATVLTMLVLRVISAYNHLDFHLQLVIARSALVKMHYDLAASSMKRTGKAADEDPLVLQYRKFVKILVDQMRSSPDESTQETLQIVQDLQLMYAKYSAHQHRMEDHMVFDHDTQTEFEYGTSLSSASSSYVGSPQRLPTSPTASNWHDTHYRGHSRSCSTSSSVGDLSTTSTKTTISEELPYMLHAFEVAKIEERNLALARNHGNLLRKSPSTASIRSTASKGPGTLSLLTNQAGHFPPYPSFRVPSATTSIDERGSKHKSSLTLSQKTETDTPGTLQVKKLGNRVMVKIGNEFVDMQDWLNKANSPRPPLVSRTFQQVKRPEQSKQVVSQQSEDKPMVLPKRREMKRRTWVTNMLGVAEEEFTSTMGI